MRTSLRADGARLLAAVVTLSLLTVEAPARADTTPQTPPFAQAWTTTTLITTNDVWTGVPGITGYSGTGMGTSGTADPQTLLGEGTETVQVWANHANPDTFASGGVAEFDGIPNPVVALQGSGTYGAPNIVMTIQTTGLMNVVVAYNLRDIDGSADDAVQRVALQYRVGTTGTYTNLPAGYVPDATTGGSATQVTPISVMLPVACENQAVVQIRVITANAAGSDEWVGIDDISITAASVLCGNGTLDTGEACDTGSANGTTTCGCQTSCQFASTTTTCAPAGTEPCDAPDTCDGAGACAARVLASGATCRASAGACDPAETCDGTSTSCPADVLTASGTTCRASTGLCDVAETCDGTTAACPADASAADGTSCDDGLMCNGADACMSGACMHAGMSCDDGNACTADACSETATPICTNVLTPAPACCNTATDCDDSDVCTTDACTGAGGSCTYDPVANCCHADADCDDANACTTDTCDTSTSRCMHTGACPDAGMPDAGMAMPDAAGSDAGARDGGAGDATTSRPDAGRGASRSSGCGCRAGERGSPGGVALGLLALAWIARRRRRLSSR